MDRRQLTDRVGRRRFGKLLVGAVVVLTAAAACGGTRLSDAQIKAANGGQGYVAAAGQIVPGTAGSTTTGSSGAPAGGTTSGQSGTGSGSTTTGGTTTTGGGTTTGGSATSGSPVGGAGGSSPTTSGATPILGSSGCAAQGSPIKIGQNGSFSGLIGNSIGGLKTGVALWAQAVNAAGGVQCHPIQLSQEDDQSDPSKTSSNVQDLIQTKHDVAILGLGDPITIASAQSVFDKAGVPVIGGDQASSVWNSDPLLFNQGGSGIPTFAGAVKAAAQKVHGTKFGLLYCLEAATCTQIKNSYEGSSGYAAKLGLTISYEQSFSLTQSSFTSDCQNAKNAGVQVLYMAADASSISRLLRDCRALNYHPGYGLSGTELNSSDLSDPNFTSEGIQVSSENQPYVSNDGPGLNAFHAAVSTYLPGQQIDQNVLAGWASGQLFAAAINALGAGVRTKDVTSAMVLQGLASLHNNTLNGLSPPLTFPKGQPSPLVTCYYLLQSSPSGYTTPKGSALQCL